MFMEKLIKCIKHSFKNLDKSFLSKIYQCFKVTVIQCLKKLNQSQVQVKEEEPEET